MLKLFGIAGRYTPVLVCDECGLPIKSASDATTYSSLDTTDTGVLTPYEQAQITQEDVLPEEFDLAVLHKECRAKYAAKHGGFEGFSLNEYLYYLLHNLKLNPKGAGLENPDE